MPKINALLSGLQNVKPRGPGRWIACCPAHDDRNPSMTIREVEDGRILIHCFAGCGVDSILGALSLTAEALFPDNCACLVRSIVRSSARSDSARARSAHIWRELIF